MRKINLLAIGLISIFSCNHQTSQQQFDIQKIKWLEGGWVRAMKGDQHAHERWQVVSPNEWHGWGVTFIGTDTSFLEKIKIIKQDDDMFYIADVPENPEPVYFRFTTLTDSGFICENPEHDFPKKIEYQLEGDTLNATISGNGESMTFSFMKQR